MEVVLLFVSIWFGIAFIIGIFIGKVIALMRGKDVEPKPKKRKRTR